MSLVWRSRLGYLSDFCVAAVIAALIWLVLSSCLGCGFAKDVGSEVGGTAVEWIACPTDLIDCGHVYLCGATEICIDDDDYPEDVTAAEAMYGTCNPTPRHQGICKWCAGPDCGRGCNAFQGCFEGPRP